MSLIQTGAVQLNQVSSVYKFHTSMEVLRLDEVHPVISGNKWFKLQYYLKEGVEKEKKVLVTYGGAYSNHLLAAAAAAREWGLKSIGIVRGEAPAGLSPTLQDASAFGMEFIFLSREAYRNKELPKDIGYTEEQILLIPEGGYGIPGAAGAAEIVNLIPSGRFTHILSAVGTGTTLAALVSGTSESQTIIGIPVLKNNVSLQVEINALLPSGKKDRFQLIHDYHFGGYAKFNSNLIQFMNEWYRQTHIPSDFVYTGKLFYAADDLVRKEYFPAGSSILLIHSGGLQGNRSLSKGTLIF